MIMNENMDRKNKAQNPITARDWMKDACEYGLDSSQRWILFMDVLRKRGNNYFETIRKGEPPVLAFDYEVILEGWTFDRPAGQWRCWLPIGLTWSAPWS
jgi:hypothetical protein